MLTKLIILPAIKGLSLETDSGECSYHLDDFHPERGNHHSLAMIENKERGQRDSNPTPPFVSACQASHRYYDFYVYF